MTANSDRGRVTVADYHAMIDSGELTEDDRVELLEERLASMTPTTPHERTIRAKLRREIEPRLPARWFLQLRQPITLSDGEPEPDLAVIRGIDEDFISRHPGPSEIGLVIEVSDSTLSRDRGIKLRSYARAGIPAYWIVDLAGGRVEAYTDPDITASIPAYRKKVIYDRRSTIPVALGAKRVGEIALASILP